MKDKIVKAYRAAWRWPEVYSESPAVIWASRIIAILLPLVLVSLTFFTGAPLFGIAAAGIIAVIVGLSLILVTVETFYQEFDSVEVFQAKEARTKEFFHGFPAITDIPLIEQEPGVCVAYGHIPPAEFIAAIQKVIIEATGDSDEMLKFVGLEDSVGHLYASFSNPDEEHWNEGLDLCKPYSEHCFPTTRVTV